MLVALVITSDKSATEIFIPSFVVFCIGILMLLAISFTLKKAGEIITNYKGYRDRK